MTPWNSPPQPKRIANPGRLPPRELAAYDEAWRLWFVADYEAKAAYYRRLAETATAKKRSGYLSAVALAEKNARRWRN